MYFSRGQRVASRNRCAAMGQSTKVKTQLEEEQNLNWDMIAEQIYTLTERNISQDTVQILF